MAATWTVTFPITAGGTGATYTSAQFNSDGGYGYLTYFGQVINEMVNVAKYQVAAMTSPSFTASSTTSNTVATGSKTFVVAETARNWAAGTSIRAASSASPANYMDGQITSYVPATNTVTINVVAIGGSGTFSAWALAPSSAVSAPITSQQPGTATAGQVLRVNLAGTAVEGVSLALTDTFTAATMPNFGAF